MDIFSNLDKIQVFKYFSNVPPGPLVNTQGKITSPEVEQRKKTTFSYVFFSPFAVSSLECDVSYILPGKSVWGGREVLCTLINYPVQPEP